MAKCHGDDLIIIEPKTVTLFFMLSKKSKWSCRKFFVDGNSDSGKVQCTINLPLLGEIGHAPTPKAQPVRNRSGKWTMREVAIQLVISWLWRAVMKPTEEERGRWLLNFQVLDRGAACGLRVPPFFCAGKMDD